MTKRDATKDIANAVSLATKQHKRILLDVGGDWRHWCLLLNTMFKADKEVARTLAERYVVVHVNWSTENENRAVLSKYPKVESFPHLFVLEKYGKLIRSQDTGALESGDHHDHAKVMAFLRKRAP